MAEMDKAKTLEEKRAALIIKYRKFNVDSVEKAEDKLVYHLSRGEQKYLMHVLMEKNTIGISYIRDLKDQVDAEGVQGGIIVGDGKYTYSARSTAPEMSIELIPPSMPAFDIFEHSLVPVHEIVGEEEKRALVDRYHAEPFQFPWIKATDPIAIILGAKAGDVVKITQKSETAGKYETYRYVV
jgi:DNA-directed RNA polymerase I, II, and III subunit RPABC1